MGIFSNTKLFNSYLTEQNYIQFFETSFQAILDTDENELMKVLVNMPHNNDEFKQTLFFINCGFPGYDYQNHFKVIRQAQNMYERNQVDIVVWSFNPIYHRRYWRWLPKRNVIFFVYFDLPSTPKFSPHLHRILMDLMNNPQYDWRERYTKYLCQMPNVRETSSLFLDILFPCKSLFDL